jgi:ParB family chromosome partitioning protein
MGLDSLIPNKNGGQGYRDDDDRFTGDELDDFSHNPSPRRERDDLGVLGSLLSGNQQQPQNNSPFEQPRHSYTPPTHTSYVSRPQPNQHYQVQPHEIEPDFPASLREEHNHTPLREEWGEPIIEAPAPIPEFESVSRGASRPAREKALEQSAPVFQIEVNKIVENPYQPRKEFDQTALDELSSSIREFGVLQPLMVTRITKETDTGTVVLYQLIAGHRRLLASKKAGLKTVPAIIRNQLKRADALEMAIVENIQREDLNVIETARAYARLSDEFGLTQREIAARLGKSRESVANTLRLLSLPTRIQDAISQGKINESHARILMQIQDPTRQQNIFDQIVNEGLSVRDTKRTLARVPVSHGPHLYKAIDPEVKSLEKDISDVVGAPVHIELSDKGGKIVIHFFSPEEAQGIAQKIKREQQY